MLTTTGSRALTIRAARQLVLAMILGQATFAGLALAVDPAPPGRSAPDPELRTWLLAVTGLALVTGVSLAFVVRARGVARAARRRTEALAELAHGELPSELVATTIAACALVEGPGLLGIVTYFLSRDALALAAPAAAVLVLLYMLPTPERLAEDMRGAA